MCWKPPQGVIGETCQSRGVAAVMNGGHSEEPSPDWGQLELGVLEERQGVQQELGQGVKRAGLFSVQ